MQAHAMEQATNKLYDPHKGLPQSDAQGIVEAGAFLTASDCKRHLIVEHRPSLRLDGLLNSRLSLDFRKSAASSY